jgi:ammonium transporter, Amt family
LVLCWAWNLEGGWLRVYGFYDRAGSIIIFHIGALGGMVGSVIVGPRYGKFMKRDDYKRM